MNKEILGVFYNEPKMSSVDLKEVEILSKHVASEMWVEYISGVSRHFMLMQADEWPSVVVSKENLLYQWQEDWNKEKYSKFQSYLQNINILENSTLYIFWMKEIALKTNWGVFFRNWANFLYEDEGCILVLPESEKSLVLSNGSAWLGKRNKPKT